MFVREAMPEQDARITFDGRLALRRWYRFFRAGGTDRDQARRLIGRMVHAADMGKFWVA